MIKCVIVEDELKSRQVLVALLNRYCPDVMVCDEAFNVEMGKEAIKKNNPDLVFLDIEMPDGSGFRLLKSFETINFEIIFTTAFEQFAIQAIRSSAIDYLLKPIVPEELVAAVEKVRQAKEHRFNQRNLENIISEIDPEAFQRKKITLNTAEKIHIVEYDKIIRCESDNYYTLFYFNDNTTLLISKTLKEVEKMLQEGNFVRPHKSHLINISYIQNYNRDDTSLTLTDGSKIPVSRRKRESILEIINNI